MEMSDHRASMDALAADYNSVFKRYKLPSSLWQNWGAVCLAQISHDPRLPPAFRLNLALKNSKIGMNSFGGHETVLRFSSDIAQVMQKSLEEDLSKPITEFDINLSFSCISGRLLTKSLSPMLFFPLHHLNLSGNKLGIDGLQALIEIFASDSSLKIERLSLGACKLGPRAAEKLVQLFNTPSLQALLSLDLSDNDLGSKAVGLVFSHLAGSKRPKISKLIEELNLSQNDIGYGGSEVIDNICRFLNLRRSILHPFLLNLDYNQLEVETLKILEKALGQIDLFSRPVISVHRNPGLNYDNILSRTFKDYEVAARDNSPKLLILQHKISFLGGALPNTARRESSSTNEDTRNSHGTEFQSYTYSKYFKEELFDVNTLAMIWEMLGFTHALKISVRTAREAALASQVINDAW